MKRVVVIALMACCWALVGSHLDAATIVGFDAARHNRFLGDGSLNPNFLIEQNAIRGVAGNPTSVANRAVLITPQHYVTAAHASTSSPTFIDNMGVAHTFSTSGSLRLTTNFNGFNDPSDILIYQLTTPIPSSLGISPLAIYGGNPNDLINQEIYVFAQDNRAGRNVIEQVGVSQFGPPIPSTGPSPSAVVRFEFNSIGGFNPDEIQLVDNDSGHASLIKVGSEYAVIGTNFGVGTGNDANQNLTTLLVPYIGQINQYVANTGQSITTINSVVAVPEPGLCFASVVITLCVARRRRRCGTPPRQLH